MEKPTNSTFTTPRSATIQEADGAYVPVNYDFQHIFDHGEFEGRVDMVQKFAHGIFRRKKDGTQIKETCVHKKVTVNSRFIEANNLTSYSHPYDFIALFFSLNGNPYSIAENPLPTFQLLAKWKNLNATLGDAVTNGSCYQDYKAFSVLELRQLMGL